MGKGGRPYLSPFVAFRAAARYAYADRLGIVAGDGAGSQVSKEIAGALSTRALQEAENILLAGAWRKLRKSPMLGSVAASP